MQVVVALIAALPAGPAIAQNGAQQTWPPLVVPAPPPPPPPVAAPTPGAPSETVNGHGHPSRRTLRGHEFLSPTTIDSPFIQTVFDTRTGARAETVDDVPIGNRINDLHALGVRESFTFDVAVNDVWGVGVSGFGQFGTGTSPRALALIGASYAYGAVLDGMLRVFRIEESGTQASLRAQLFGAQGGQRLTLVPFLRSVRNMPAQTVAALITNFGELIEVPASWYGGAASFNVAQAITPLIGIQASFRLDLRRFHQAPFVPGVGRVDVDSTGWLPSVGVAVDIRPPDSPVAFIAEYRTAAQDSNDPTSRAHHLVGVGVYYVAQHDLELGLNGAGEFGLPPITGIDADGNPVDSKRGKALTGQFVLRYFW